MLVQHATNNFSNYSKYNQTNYSSKPSFKGSFSNYKIQKSLIEKGFNTTAPKFLVKAKNFIKSLFGQKTINKIPISDISKKSSKPNLKKELKKYIKGLKTGENIDPNKIEELLINSGAKDVTKAEGIFFQPTAEYPVGKKKKFILNGKSYILETHNGQGSMDTITRLYEDGAKNERNYLTRNGTFEKDSYFSAFTHLFSGMKGSSWIKLTA
mgnify:CR=1 FL=1